MRRITANLAGLTLACGLAIVLPGKAFALPGCEVPVPPPACSPQDPTDPEPPAGSDQPATGIVDYQENADGRIRVTGWASDINGGPVLVQLKVDGVVRAAELSRGWRPDRQAYVGFDLAATAPTSNGEHTITVLAVNVPDGTSPVPAATELKRTTYFIKPPAPTDPVFVAAIVNSQTQITVTFTDNSMAETAHVVTYDWMEYKLRRGGGYGWVPEARTVYLPPQAGTGRYSHTITNLPSNTFFKFYLSTRENEFSSETLLGSVATPS
ncbi:Ig-like domain-containing protein [Micromonospora sp. NPDC092111]|uniref:Ig-like domain-containing protein n=1 Tax=Micromonospora sp. NPDC092111 TaxID=3364289 RepID=UPI003815AF46